MARTAAWARIKDRHTPSWYAGRYVRRRATFAWWRNGAGPTRPSQPEGPKRRCSSQWPSGDVVGAILNGPTPSGCGVITS